MLEIPRTAVRTIRPTGIHLLGEASERGQTVVTAAVLHGVTMLLPSIRTTIREVVINGVPEVAAEETHGIRQATITSGTTIREAINGEEAVTMEDGTGLEMIKTTEDGTGLEMTRIMEDGIILEMTKTMEDGTNLEMTKIMEDGTNLEMAKTLRALGTLATMQILVMALPGVVIPGVTAPQTTNSKPLITTITKIRGSQILQQNNEKQHLP